MELTNCLCGSKPVMQFSENRVTRRKAANSRLAKAESVAHNAGPARKEFELALEEVRALADDVIEVRCLNCDAFIWHQDEFHAANRWNRAREKLDNLAACCLESSNQDVRIDADGMKIVRCNVCGIRHLPLK